MPTIIQKEDSNADVLRETAHPVPKDKIESEEIQGVINDMKETLADVGDGVAIAAPQIGKPLRIFVVSGAVFEERNKAKGREPGDEPDRVYINPKIVNTSSTTVEMEEGCLSCRWWYGTVERADKATVRALNEDGEEFTEGASGLLAQIFQHETDHLDGILFVDKADNLRELPPEGDNPADSDE